jgi:3-oxoacyl-[acyl-carrier protein] reductase
VTDTGWVTEEVRAFVRASLEQVHVAAAEDVAAVIAWLASDLGALVTANRVHLR